MNNKKQMSEVWKQMKSKVNEREKRVWRTGSLRHYRLENGEYRMRIIMRTNLHFLYKGFNGREEIWQFESKGYSLRNLEDLRKFRWAERKAEEAKYVGLDALLVGTPLCEDVIGEIMSYI